MESLLEKLTRLSSQRSARTDRLLEATHALLGKLEPLVEVGDTVEVDGGALQRVRCKSNVGYTEFWEWSFGDEFDGRSCMLCEALDADRYLHSDFHCRIIGPTRDDLLEFAVRAQRIVEAFVTKFEREGEILSRSADDVAQAAGQL